MKTTSNDFTDSTGLPNRSPAGADRSPAGADRAPAGADRAPAGADRAPAGADRAPAGAGVETAASGFEAPRPLPGTSVLTATPTSLLISVRSEQEMLAAIDGGADIVDLKEPRQGPLAPTSKRIWQLAAKRIRQFPPVQLSAALGESDQSGPAAIDLPASFSFAKAGPSGCRSTASLQRLWHDVLEQMDPSIELVAVAYADHGAADCLPAPMVLATAAEFGLRRCLIDTFAKDGRTSLDHLGIAGLQQLAEVAAQNKQWWAIAGSMRVEHVARLRHHGIEPNCWGVRGDVCDRGRGGSLVAERVARWKVTLQGNVEREHDANRQPTAAIAH